MKKTSNLLHICLLIIVYCSLLTGICTAQTLSPAARVSVLTVGPGNELYSSFGHTVLRIQDPMLGLDRPYSYGTFDFRTENFYLKFIRGTLPYTLSVSDLGREMQYWQYENRSVTEQVLQLSARQKQRLFEALETNYLPENREYRYKFYYDNCTSRIRDQLANACGDSLTFTDRNQPTGLSYRDAMNLYLRQKHWERFGMNLALGRPSDHEMTVWQSMYLPENLMAQLRRATVRLPDGSQVPVVGNEQKLIDTSLMAPAVSPATPFYVKPWFVFFGLLALVLLRTQADHQRNQPSAWLDRLIFCVYGLAGWFLFLLWVGTDHGVTNWNPALLLFFPLYFPLIFRATRPGKTAVADPFFRAVWWLLGVYLIGLGLFLLYDYVRFAPGKRTDLLVNAQDFAAYAALVGIVLLRVNLRYPFSRLINR